MTDEISAKMLGIEETTVSEVSSILGVTFRKILALLTAVWPGDDAPRDTQREALARLPLAELLTGTVTVQEYIARQALRALVLGVSSASAQAESVGVDITTTANMRRLSPLVRMYIKHLGVTVEHKVAQADAGLQLATTFVGATAALAIAKQGVNSAELTAAYVVNQAHNEGISAVSHESPRVVSVWHAERNACLHCLAYQGEVDIGDGYPEGLTYGATPLDTGPVMRPPLHPRCRCTQEIVTASDVADYVGPLKREAARSVLRGWSTPSESGKARLDAAERLLKKGTTLPKSVQSYAKRAIQAGEFPASRDFPV